MDPLLTVTCAHIGWKFSDEWVYRLKHMVEFYCSVPVRFVCFSDHDIDGVEVIPVARQIVRTDQHHSRLHDSPDLILNEHKPQGCWAKLECFRPGLFETPVINFDLDVVILDDIWPLRRDRLHMAYEGSPRSEWNGSVYSFTPHLQTEELYVEKIPYSTRPRGEQEWVHETYGRVGTLRETCSFKRHVASRPGKLPPPGTRVVYFHGRPTPAADSVQDIGWISRTWKGFERADI